MAPMQPSSFLSPLTPKLSSQLRLSPTHQNQLACRRCTQLTRVHFYGGLITVGNNNNNNNSSSSNNNNHGRGNGGLGGGGGGGGGGDRDGGGGGGDRHGGGGDRDDGGGASDTNLEVVRFVLEQAGRELKSLPDDLVAAIMGGRVTGETMLRFLKIASSPLLRWFLQFRGFRERLLADDLFLAKLAIACLVGAIAKIATKYENKGENSSKEIDKVTASAVMGILVYVSAPTVSLQPPFATNAGLGASLSHNIPAAASRIAFIIGSYLLLHKLQATVVGTVATDGLVIARKAVVKQLDDIVEEIPAVPSPDKPKEKWWSRFEAGVEIVSYSSMRGGRLDPATRTKVSASLSRGSFGQSR